MAGKFGQPQRQRTPLELVRQLTLLTPLTLSQLIHQHPPLRLKQRDQLADPRHAEQEQIGIQHRIGPPGLVSWGHGY